MTNAQQVERILAQAEQAIAQGSVLSALALLRQALQIDATNAYAATRLADLLLRQEQVDEAEALLRSAIEQAPRFAPAHLLLARVALHRSDRDAALASLDHAILHDNGAWGARVEKAQLLESIGRKREAALCWREAVRSMPESIRESPQFRGMVEHARDLVTSDSNELRDYLMANLQDTLQNEAPAHLERFQHALDIVTGRRQFVTANPLFLPIPRLPAIPYFDRGDFDWAPKVEAATDEIRCELKSVMGEIDGGFIPYVQTRAGSSSGQFSPLDGNAAWSAYFLWKHGERIEEHCAACPTAAATVEAVPLPRIRARAPAAFFSRLDPGVHIPPHNGATNARLTVHLPLIVPDGCTFRVGDETRAWKEGELLIFDDTIRHEAWNGSDRQRVVMIFDVWHPMLSAVERELITRTVEGLVEFYGDSQELSEL